MESYAVKYAMYRTNLLFSPLDVYLEYYNVLFGNFSYYKMHLLGMFLGVQIYYYLTQLLMQLNWLPVIKARLKVFT